jgi:quinol monooxygenase YgiN
LELEENVKAHEADCLVYRMTKSREEPGTYMNMELYRDQAALDLHQQTEYFQKALDVFKTCLGGVPTVEFFDTLV